MATLKRVLVGPDEEHGPSRGRDVFVVKRALRRFGELEGLGEDFFQPPKGGYDEVYNARTVDAVEAAQKWWHLPVDGIYGPKTHDRLWPYFDAYGKWVYRRFKPITRQDEKFQRLLGAMEILSINTPGYQLGGGHGIPLSQVSPYQKLDCSSSCSKALYEAGMFPHTYSWVSGEFAQSYGMSGPGKYFTVYANWEHVFIRLHKSRWWRFDTSPHGDGGRGPKLRMLPRFTSGFAVRHWPGM